MLVLGTVVYADTFRSKKEQKLYTKLFVPVGNEVTSVIAEGDLTALVGVEDVPFNLRLRDNQLKLYYAREEE